MALQIWIGIFNVVCCKFEVALYGLTHISQASFLWDTGKQPERSIWSGSPLFAVKTGIKHHPTPLKSEVGST